MTLERKKNGLPISKKTIKKDVHASNDDTVSQAIHDKPSVVKIWIGCSAVCHAKICKNEKGVLQLYFYIILG